MPLGKDNLYSCQDALHGNLVVEFFYLKKRRKKTKINLLYQNNKIYSACYVVKNLFKAPG